VLDKQIVDLDGRRVVRVNDLQLTEVRGELLLVAADIGIRGILRRLGLEALGKAVAHLFGRNLPMVLVAWNVVSPLEPQAVQAAAAGDELRLRISGKRIAKLHPADIADIVEDLGAKDRKAVFESLEEEIAADTLEEMELEDQVSVIEVADILAEMPQERAQEILGLMESEERDDVQELLAFRDDTAGGLMTTEFVAVSEALTAQQSIDELRRMEPDAESVYYVFVVDGQEHLQGVLSLRDLIVSSPDKPIREFMIRDVVTVRPEASAHEVAAVLSKYNLLAVPVVDEEHHLRGIVTVDDALDEVLPDSVKRKLPRPV
ncbi:MAG: magnesium transporter, partial [Chloroflexi bacterium]